jgi:hypothetical protein
MAMLMAVGRVAEGGEENLCMSRAKLEKSCPPRSRSGGSVMCSKYDVSYGATILMQYQDIATATSMWDDYCYESEGRRKKEGTSIGVMLWAGTGLTSTGEA